MVLGCYKARPFVALSFYSNRFAANLSSFSLAVVPIKIFQMILVCLLVQKVSIEFKYKLFAKSSANHTDEIFSTYNEGCNSAVIVLLYFPAMEGIRGQNNSGYEHHNFSAPLFSLCFNFLPPASMTYMSRLPLTVYYCSFHVHLMKPIAKFT